MSRSLVVLVVAIAPPLIICGLVLGGPAASLLMFGALTGALNTVSGGFRLGALASAFLLLATPLALLAGQVPLAGACLLAIVCLAVGISAGWGLNGTLMLVPLSLAYLMVVPLPVRELPEDPASQTYLLWVLGGMALCAYWAAAAVYVLIRNKQLPRPAGNSRSDTLEYTVIMTVLVSVSMYFVLAYAREEHGVWLVLTLLILLQTDTRSTLRKSKNRIIGTVAGVLLGALLVSVIPSNAVLTILAAGCLLGVFTFILGGPYYLYTFCLTLVLVLTAAPAGDALQTAVERSAFTLLGAVLAIVGIALGDAVQRHAAARHPSDAADRSASP